MTNGALTISRRRSRQRRTTPRERSQWVKAWEGSGKTQREFADSHGLSVATLRSWIRRGAPDSGAKVAVVEFEEIRLETLVGKRPSPSPVVWEAEIRLPTGVVIAVSPGIEPKRVRALLEAMGC